MSKRILIFSLAYYPSHVSGAEIAIREITDRIDPTDITFDLITLLFDSTQPRTETIGNVTVHRVGMGTAYLSKILFTPLAALAARRLHHSTPFDGVWAMMTYMLFPTILARLLGVRVPYALTLQDGDTYEKVFERWFIAPLTPILDYGFRHATVIQAISYYLATWPRLRDTSVPVEIIHNGGNPADFTEDSVSEIELLRMRVDLGIAKTDVLLGNTARLVPQKGWEDIIRALVLLPIHVKLLVVGSGPDEDVYRTLVRALKLEHRVIFVGQVERVLVTKYRRMLDIFVMPSRSEGLGNAGLSAMASRKPVIATQVGGLADFVFDQIHNPDRAPTAWVVAPNSPTEIAAAVTAIITHPEQEEEVTNNAYDMVSEHFRWDSIAHTIREKVFARIVGSSTH
jgi:glycosyltransferase involved in cell wall biosynthesis